VAGSKRNRRRTGREARIAAAEAARRKAARRRLLLIGGAAVVVVVAVVVIVLVARSGSDKKKVTTSATTTSIGPTTTVAGATGSAAGKPCVAMSDAAPAGAPTVPVKVGPPPTELVKDDLKVGTGAPVTPGATVTVNYIGVSCTTGKVFDSSYSRNQTATFPLNQVIKGWTDGIPGMNVGGQRLLGIPAAQAYGPQGRPPTIAPDEPLWFVVEVVDTKPA
jgi:peptidylprolyl isomerase